MKIRLNGQIALVDLANSEEITSIKLQNLLNYLEEKNYFGTRKPSSFAVALNQNFIPKTAYAEQKIAPLDEVEVIFPHPGG